MTSLQHDVEAAWSTVIHAIGFGSARPIVCFEDADRSPLTEFHSVDGESIVCCAVHDDEFHLTILPRRFAVRESDHMVADVAACLRSFAADLNAAAEKLEADIDEWGVPHEAAA